MALTEPLVLTLAAAALSTTAALAQSTKSETRFQDWLVTCDDSSGAKKCSLSQTFTKAGTTEVVLAWILAKETDGSLKAVVYTPTQVRLPPGLSVAVEGLDAKVVPYSYCAPQACVAEFPFGDDWLGAFRKQSEYSVTFQPVNVRPATVKGSLKGFTVAYDFFVEQQP